MTEGQHNNQLRQPTSSVNGGEGYERLLKAYETYNSLVNGKLKDFEIVKNYLAETLEQLLAEGKIGPGVLLSSRIKSPASVVENWKLGKDLNDIFGITLLTTNQNEMNEIREALRKERKFNISSKKEMNEKRGYEAIHFMFNVGEEEKTTKVECHMQTHEQYKEMYTHIFYKVRRKLKRDLTSEEEKLIEEKVQNMYESGELGGYQLSEGKKSRIPEMWVTSFNPQGKMEEQQLDEKMILTIMYPFLDVSKKKTENQEQGETEKLPVVEELEM